MSRTFAAILLIVVLVVGGGIIATAAYQAGRQQRRHDHRAQRRHAAPSSHRSSSPPTATASRLAPVRVRSSASSSTLFFLFLVFGLIRAIFFRRPAASGAVRLGRAGATAAGDGATAASRFGAGTGRRPRRRDEWHRGAHWHRRRAPTRPSPDADPAHRAIRARLTRAPPSPSAPRAIGPGAHPSLYDAPHMKTILVVDDEPKIVQLARDYLEHAGFAVLTAADGPAAARGRRASTSPTSSSSTSVFPASTGSTSPARSAATRRSRS